MPVIMSLSPRPVMFNEVPFPAITVCNMNNMRKSEAEKIFYAAEHGLYNEAFMDNKLVYDFCDRDPPKNLKNKSLGNSATWDYIQKFMINISQPCHEMFMHCEWHSEKQECMDFFNPSLTDEGICCVFNRLKREHIFNNPRDLSDLNLTFPGETYDWSPEKGFPKNLSPDTLPRRAKGPGSQLGLSIVVNAELEEYYCSTDNSQGFKVMINNPLETPKVSSFALSVEPGKETKIVLTPKVITATEQLRRIDISKRECYFENEKQLFFYRTYSQRSCHLECEANFTIELCGCVLYYMPKNATTRICGKMDKRCYNFAQKILEQSAKELTANAATKRLKTCNCLPACHEISYSYMLTTSRITDSLKIDPVMLGRFNTTYFKQNMAIIHFYYIERQFTSTIRGVLFGFTEFLSNTGGLLGLFFGFSFLSAVEIVYFLMLRVFCEQHKRKRPENDVEKNVTTQLSIADPKFFIKPPLPFIK
ncbi:pickpocket protein 28-like isoform X2 [Rhodnius prolixus]